MAFQSSNRRTNGLLVVVLLKETEKFQIKDEMHIMTRDCWYLYWFGKILFSDLPVHIIQYPTLFIINNMLEPYMGITRSPLTQNNGYFTLTLFGGNYPFF